MVDLDTVRCHGKHPVVIAGNRVCKKYRRRIWKKECKNLKNILPSVANKKVSDVEVIEEAVGYIEHLEKAIAQRLGVLPCPQMIAALHMQHFMKIASQATADNCLSTSTTPPRVQYSQIPFLNQLTHISNTQNNSNGLSQVGHELNLLKHKQKLATTLRV